MENKTEFKPFFKNLNRKEYVEKVSQIISAEGVEAVSIRRLARELDCSTASMYRYFRNLDELLYYAQLSALNNYIMELSKAEKTWKNVIECHLGIWELYAKEAFKNPKAFECIFYKNINNDLGDALKEYYEMFPDTIVHVSDFLKNMLEITEYFARDYYVLTKLVNEGILTEDNAVKLNHTECLLFLGYFKMVQSGTSKQYNSDLIAEDFIRKLKDLLEMYRIK